MPSYWLGRCPKHQYHTRNSGLCGYIKGRPHLFCYLNFWIWTVHQIGLPYRSSLQPMPSLQGFNVSINHALYFNASWLTLPRSSTLSNHHATQPLPSLEHHLICRLLRSPSLMSRYSGLSMPCLIMFFRARHRHQVPPPTPSLDACALRNHSPPGISTYTLLMLYLAYPSI